MAKIGSFIAKIRINGTQVEGEEASGSTFVEPNNKNLEETIAQAVQHEYQLDNPRSLRDLSVSVTIEDTMDDK